MRIFVLLMLFIYAGLNNISFAQTPAQNETKYKAAVSDIKKGAYNIAIEKLAPLTSTSIQTPYSPYAHYYYGLAAYNLKRYRESKQMLLQLISRYPAWNKINDVYYLLGANHLATEQYKEGLGFLQRIKDSSYNKDVQGLKQHYFGEVKDLAKLKEIQKQFPEDRDIAIELIQFIDRSPTSTKTDALQAEQLVSQFKVSSKEKNSTIADGPQKSIPKTAGQWDKGYLNVSVMLPFRLDEFNTSKRRTNQFAYDYYLGLVQAQKQLETEGIKINLVAYDVTNEAKSINGIVGNPEFQQSDLVIGPLYPNTFDVAAGYVSSADMFMLNPLSTDASLLNRGENMYLAHPSIQFQTQKAAEWMKTVAPGPAVAIYYGNNAKDSVMAFSYANEIKTRGGRIIEMLKIISDREWLENKMSQFATSKPSHVALFASDGSSGVNVLEILNARAMTTVPVLANSASFNMQQSRLGKYGSRLFLIETDYVDREKEKVREFQKSYWAETNTFPSSYSYQGYDQLLFFGRMLAKYKDGLKRGLEMRKYDDDYLLSGFDFTKSRENQISPLLKYSGTKWVPVR
ncbi:amino acid/amide ABC transporter substrate-binding protein, HAAT family [Dyadobacter koreensis]|uniref:Amino acid/amide ABC transporter substrate-binding protein, HAAT family n=1 Tax=Dyadobacter koreensis TaxID=408657 RepID=A0A1H6V4B9_9BACT|nr:outer membrane protein assembly factor BamD [Dyadobacter koreensis]SEI96647.1 amino acid/amide ABC transporter substrate-binding protein, HAAT family [Dyadobacter koreensis]